MRIRWFVTAGLLLTLAALSACATQGDATREQTTRFRIDGVLHELPVAEGNCVASEKDLDLPVLSTLVSGRIGRRLAALSVQLDCAALQKLRSAGTLDRARITILGMIRFDDGLTFADDKLIKYLGLKSAILPGTTTSARNRKHIVESIVAKLNEKQGRDVTCQDIQSNETSLGGRICTRFNSNGSQTDLILAISTRPYGNRLIALGIVDVAGFSAARPTFADADAILSSMRPVQPE